MCLGPSHALHIYMRMFSPEAAKSLGLVAQDPNFKRAPNGGSLPGVEGFLRHQSDVIAHRLPPFLILGCAIPWPIFATGIEESGDTQTRAIELTDLVRSIFHHQEVGCPEQRKLVHVQ